MTIHKRQGLPLDCAIIDLSCKVFADGMAYVALSRVKSLEGLHLTFFDSHSIRVSLGCIKEINRLKKLHRTDLPQIDVPVAVKRGNRMVTGSCDMDNKETKNNNTVSDLKHLTCSKRSNTCAAESDGSPCEKIMYYC